MGLGGGARLVQKSRGTCFCLWVQRGPIFNAVEAWSTTPGLKPQGLSLSSPVLWPWDWKRHPSPFLLGCWLGLFCHASGPASTGGSGQRALPKLSVVWRSPGEQEPPEADESLQSPHCWGQPKPQSTSQPPCPPRSPSLNIWRAALLCALTWHTRPLCRPAVPFFSLHSRSHQLMRAARMGKNPARADWWPRVSLQLPTTVRFCHRLLKTWHSYWNKWALKGNPDLLYLPLISWLSSWRSGPSFWHLMNKMPTLQEMG